MILYDAAPTSLDVEHFLLHQLESLSRTPQQAADERLPNERIYKITIEVEEL